MSGWQGIIISLLAALLATAQCQRLLPQPEPLALGSNLSIMVKGTLASGGRTIFVLQDDKDLLRCLGMGPDKVASRYIHAELWNLASLKNANVTGASNSMESRADPMLMMANSRTPPEPKYQTHQSEWSWTPPSTHTDYEGYRLLRPYHHVIAAVNDSAANSDPWYITIANIDIWMMQDLQYSLRVSCVEQPPCPSLSLTDPCSGHGTCNAGSCVCDISGAEQAWGDVGCNTKVARLENGVTVKGSQAQGDWSYYVVQVPERSSMLLVEMSRVRGDPVLFVKYQDEGFAKGGLPAVLDYDTYADQDSFRSRLNYHHLAIPNPKAGVYYVGVYNNDVYIKEGATFSVKARWSTAGGLAAFCPADCNPPQGTCLGLAEGARCECKPGFGGELCEGVHMLLDLGNEAQGLLNPAQWIYYRLTLDSNNKNNWKNGLVVEFSTDDRGHPVLILKRDGFPSMLQNDYIFTSSQMLQGRKRFKLEGQDLAEGDYIFGIFNMDYYRHQQMGYVFKVSVMETGSLLPFTPYMSIVLGVTVSLFLCLFMSICKRLIQRRGLFGHALPDQAAQGQAGQGGAGCRGVDRNIIESFPSYPYEPREDDSVCARVASASGKPADDADVERNSEAEPSCAVCLCAYESGEMMRKLPCEHEFHMKCIDQWLTQRITCPMCRVALVSEPGEGDHPDADGAQGAVSPPESPPGTADSMPPSPSAVVAALELAPMSARNDDNNGNGASTSSASSSAVSNCVSASRAHALSPQAPEVVVSDVNSEEAHPINTQHR